MLHPHNIPSPQTVEASLQRITACTKARIEQWILVSVTEQKLHLLQQHKVLQYYPVSTSKYGTGNQQGSYQTPLGVHTVAEKIGAGAAINTIFQARQSTGQQAIVNANEGLANDLITSRILWLQGQEAGINRGGNVDSYRRYIYIHGTANEAAIGTPVSIGCIRMYNQDIIALYQQTALHTPVLIV